MSARRKYLIWAVVRIPCAWRVAGTGSYDSCHAYAKALCSHAVAVEVERA